MAAKKTRADFSLFFIILIIPVKKADMPEIPAISIGIVSAKLLKNVSPPRWPEATRSRNVINSKKKTIINPTDNLPKKVFGAKFIVICFILPKNRLVGDFFSFS